MSMREPVSPRVWTRLACCLAAAALLCGCGKEGEKLVPVEGKVLINGKALSCGPNAPGSVSLHPDKAKGNESLHIPLGEIDSEGNFKIKTYVKDGAAPGWYKVTVTAAKVIDPKNPYHSAS